MYSGPPPMMAEMQKSSFLPRPSAMYTWKDHIMLMTYACPSISIFESGHSLLAVRSQVFMTSPESGVSGGKM